MTIRHNETSGEAPPLPVSIPLVQMWGEANNLSGEFRMDWITLRSDDWPEGEYPRTVYEQARKVPGTALTFTHNGNRYRVVWSEGPAPAAFTSVAPPVASATIPVEQLRADWNKLRMAPRSDEPTMGPQASEKTPRDYARAAQERLFPRLTWKLCSGPLLATVDHVEGRVTMLPEICIMLRASIRGDSDPWPREQLQEVQAMIEARIRTWASPQDAIDGAVTTMMGAALILIEKELRERTARGADY